MARKVARRCGTSHQKGVTGDWIQRSPLGKMCCERFLCDNSGNMREFITSLLSRKDGEGGMGEGQSSITFVFASCRMPNELQNKLRVCSIPSLPGARL